MSLNAPSPWDNPALIARLRELWLRGDTTRQIAAALGVTPNSVIGKAHRIGLPRRPSPIKRSDNPQPRVYPRAKHCLALGQTMPPAPPFPDPIRAGRSEPCCWVTSNGRPWTYCNAPGVPGKPYCEAHLGVSLLRKCA